MCQAVTWVGILVAPGKSRICNTCGWWLWTISSPKGTSYNNYTYELIVDIVNPGKRLLIRHTIWKELKQVGHFHGYHGLELFFSSFAHCSLKWAGMVAGAGGSWLTLFSVLKQWRMFGLSYLTPWMQSRMPARRVVPPCPKVGLSTSVDLIKVALPIHVQRFVS